MNKNILNLLLFPTVAVMLFPLFATGQSAFGPRLTATELRYDMGVVKQGVQAVHVFEIRNEGTDTLLIQRIQPG